MFHVMLSLVSTGWRHSEWFGRIKPMGGRKTWNLVVTLNERRAGSWMHIYHIIQMIILSLQLYYLIGPVGGARYDVTSLSV